MAKDGSRTLVPIANEEAFNKLEKAAVDKKQNAAAEKLNAELQLDIVSKTLDVIEEMASVEPRVKAKKRKSNLLLFWKKFGADTMAVLLFVCVGATCLILKSIEEAEQAKCVNNLDDCKADPSNAECSNLSGEGVTSDVLSHSKLCRFDKQHRILGAPVWLWLLFFALYLPLGWVSRAVIAIVEQVIGLFSLFSGNVVFFMLGIHLPAAQFLRALMWLVSWILLLRDALKDAQQSATINVAAGEKMLTKQFDGVYDTMWRLLLCLCLLQGARLLRASFLKWLSLRYHHRNQLEKMQDALVKEHLIQLMSKPLGVDAQRLSDKVELKGLAKAHVAALQFVALVKNGSVVPAKGDLPAEAVAELQARATRVFDRLTDAVLLEHRRNRLEAEKAAALGGCFGCGGSAPPPRATRTATKEFGLSPSGDGGGSPAKAAAVPPAPDHSRPSRSIRAGVEHVESLTRSQIQQEVEQSGGSMLMPLEDAVRLSVRGNVSVPGSMAESQVPPPGATDAIAGSALKELVLNQSTANVDESTLDALGQELRSAQTVPTITISSALSKLENYFSGNFLKVPLGLEHLSNRSRLREFLGDDDADDDCVDIDTRLAAKKLGYYLYWNLKHDAAGVVLSAADLQHVAPELMGSSGADDYSQGQAAWRVLDRNDDGQVTLSEVIESVEEVYKSRKYLAKTLLDSKSVVAQVGTAFSAIMWIALLFVFVAVFDVSAFRSTWAAMSASLLSLSFIFGNSIRQVWENGVFLFFNHPFDVGDFVRFGGEGYHVTRISLGFVNLRRIDGADVNIAMEQMRSVQLHNVTRSGEKWEWFKLHVDIETSREALHVVAESVLAYMREQPAWFTGLYRVYFTGMALAYKLEMSVIWEFNNNGTDLFLQGNARTGLILAVARALTAAGVSYTLPPVKGAKPGSDGGGEAPMHVRAAAGGVGDGATATNALNTTMSSGDDFLRFATAGAVLAM